MSLPYGRQCIDKDDITAIENAVKSSFLTTGPRVAAFEDRLCRLTGAKHAVACASGTAALHLACLALDIGDRDLGLTTPNSFLASANCIEYCKGRVDFVDIDPATLCLSPERLEDYCSTIEVPKVVIPVDFAGRAADLSEIRKLSDRFGFFVIEDAAHAIGSFYPDGNQSHACGSCIHSDLAVFSFHPVKTITTGEGGAVMTNDDALARRLYAFRNHGMEKTDALDEEHGPWYYEMQVPGFNYRITDIQCALGLSQLDKLDRFTADRRKIAAYYDHAFAGRERLILPPLALEQSTCPHLYPIQVTGGPGVRKALYEALKQDDIFCQVHYIPIYWQPYYRDRYMFKKGKCPAAETYYSRCLSLPLFPAMKEADAKHVVDRVLAHLSGISLSGEYIT